jgi:hypothetical protein
MMGVLRDRVNPRVSHGRFHRPVNRMGPSTVAVGTRTKGTWEIQKKNDADVLKTGLKRFRFAVLPSFQQKARRRTQFECLASVIVCQRQQLLSVNTAAEPSGIDMHICLVSFFVFRFSKLFPDISALIGLPAFSVLFDPLIILSKEFWENRARFGHLFNAKQRIKPISGAGFTYFE